MASALTRHSRLVFWLKIVLPILALAILSTMFLFARRIDFEGALPYAEVDIDALANDPRLTRPEFSGMTDDGAAITVAAATARPGKTATDPMTADEVIAVYQSESGKRITIQARTGSFGSAGNSLTLTGDVVLCRQTGVPSSCRRSGAAAVGQNGVAATAALAERRPEAELSGPELGEKRSGDSPRGSVLVRRARSSGGKQ